MVGEKIDYYFNNFFDGASSYAKDIVNSEIVHSVRRFHESLPGYTITPLINLSSLAKFLGVCDIFVKDESKRFGLNAFKVLGASYAIARVLAAELDLDAMDLTFDNILSHIHGISPWTFVTATDGNHGKAVAWAADKFGCNSVVFMPQGSSEARVQAISLCGADVSVLNCNYDAAVMFAEKTALENNWILMQDTAWLGYEIIPKYIMQGYFTLLSEIMSQVENKGFTHVFVQAGVGTFAAAMALLFNNFYSQALPVFIVVESIEASCFLHSLKIGDGEPHTIQGNFNTIMAGLACGKPSTSAWEILRTSANAFIACSDDISELGMRLFGDPIGEDLSIISGESGSVTLGLIYCLLVNKKYKDLKEMLGINSDSRILLFSTEGDTDPVNYRKIMTRER